MAEINSIIPQPEKNLTILSQDNTMTHDVSEEFSLPDYVPEVRRVLITKGSVLPESKYLSDGQGASALEFGGTVAYSLIYTDEEGKLCALPLSSSYEVKTQLSSRPDSVMIDTVVDSVSTRVSAPRRLSIKSRLRSRILGIERKEMNENITPKSSADELYIERKSENASNLSLKEVSIQNVRMSDKFDMGTLKEARPIWCDAKIILNDVKASNNSVSVRGEATVKCLCDTENGIVTLTKTMPVAEELEAEGVTTGEMARASGRCVSLSISNEESNSGAQLFFDLNCEIEGEVAKNSDVSLLNDCYSTKCQSENTYKTIDIYSALKTQNASFTSSESVKRKNNEIVEIVELLADPVYEKTEIKNGKAQMLGTLNVDIIGKSKENENGESEYLSDSYEIPIKYECDLARVCGEIINRCDFSLGNINARYDTDKFYCTAEILPSYTIIEKNKMQILDSCVLKKDKEIKNDASCVRVYFPKDSDTLWEVAKKYHTTVKAIAEQNELDTNAPLSAKNIII